MGNIGAALARFWTRFRRWEWWQQALVWVVFAPLPLAAWAAAGSAGRRIVAIAAIAMWVAVVVAALAADDGSEQVVSSSTTSRTSAAEPATTSAASTEPSAPTSRPDAGAPTSTPATTTATTVDQTGPQLESTEAPALLLLDQLPVQREHIGGYDRDLFEHWIDADGDGCDTRSEVLQAESLGPVTYTNGCRVDTGAWISLYDDLGFTAARELDIDHLVPLAEAWGSGAWEWDAARRRAFANDIADPEALIAVSASSNRSKGADDPAEWLPPAPSARCGYARDWVVVKTIWSLTINVREANVLRSVLDECDSGTATLVDAAEGRPLPAPPPTQSSASPVCDPNYTGACVPPYPPDLDCADISGPVQVIGTDPHGLDGDGDGIGCE